ncbi:Chromatin structure-remodeling complex subunit sfh1 [Sparassis crispa]|uniref:Chromatin structure-remodeling complex subunit sfh1 n=1 Tax=Sparassis crispa TaxID=139825 RepID=A0A401GGZ1_9APHY|nr:Chromatin structure-remodeling complex subunit sfh1 [Sparassis crispa]GBE81395.1 Chromatin structure-remodeling complex subunit sfh1 [Sparassis crispa]
MAEAQVWRAPNQLLNVPNRASQSSVPPQAAHPAYFNNIRQWSNSVTPPPTNGRINPSRKSNRPHRGSTLASTPQTQASTSTYQPAPPAPTFNPPPLEIFPSSSQSTIATTPQALHSTYASRLRTGATLLVQPTLASSSATAVATRSSRRGGVVNYADPGSGDEFPDAGAIDSDDSDFVASGGTRSAVRAARLSSKAPAGASVFHAGSVTPAAPAPPQPPQRAELDQSYLGMVPPSRYITAKPVYPTRHDYFPPEAMEAQAKRSTALVPIRVEFETDTHRIRDCFVWNLHEDLIKPEAFARTFCVDLDLPPNPWADTVANQIRAQLEDHEGVAAMDLGADTEEEELAGGDEVGECRVILSIDVQIATYHLLDHIEWDLLSPLTPEAFAVQLGAELGLSGEAIPLIAHAVHEELVKHKRDAIEWGVMGGDNREVVEDLSGDKPRDKSGLSLLKDKTGLGLGWGRTPKDGRGPKALKSVWRDWAEAEEFKTRFEVLSAEEVERREIERERASRRLRRETSKFQSQIISKRRR